MVPRERARPATGRTANAGWKLRYVATTVATVMLVASLGAGSADATTGSAGANAGSAGVTAGSADAKAGSAGVTASSADAKAGSAGVTASSAGANAGSAGAPVSAADATGEAVSEVTVTGRVEPDTVTIGTRFRYTVEVNAPAGLDVVLSQPTERIGDFDIVDFGDAPVVEEAGRQVVTRWYTLVGWDPGYYFLDSPPVLHRVGDADYTPAPADKTVITVESLLKSDENAVDVRDIKGVEAVPVDWRPYWLAGGVLLTIVALGAGIFWLLNRHDRSVAPIPAKPPHEIAYAELARLRRRGLVQQGAFKEYYSGLSGIVRTYVEQRFGLRAPEMTTEEFLIRSAREGALQGTHRGLLAGFLVESDLVKFARHLPTIDDSERAYDATKRFVDETAARPAEGADAAR